ncbi:glycosyltransferase family 39 protein [Microbacterium sp. BWT-B31]|uniref:dolichyl-phosphate-mannose--protein mannosyltransferase n=1 Tax=Microbacterium sp. BWT-B31 TaxID=3232072 RepID=UPI0035272314
MTTTAEPLLPAARLTLYDRWSARVASSPELTRRWSWLAPLVVTLVAGILRVANLANPHAVIFDETYYVKDAWSQWLLGFPSKWPDGADQSFLNGDTEIFTGEGSFVVHPPLGKFFIGAGMALFGADSTFGWRIAVCVFGTATVLVLYHLAKSLTGSIAFATVASGLMAVDGMAIAMSRVAILDGISALFVVLTFWFVVLDRRGHLDRLTAAIAARRAAASGDEPDVPWGPVLWNRPWVVAAGAAAGAATAVKWSGLYVIAGLGIYLVVTDALARRRAGVGNWPRDAVRQGVASFVLFVPVAFVVYLASWTGWLATDGGYGRHDADADPATGFWSWVPLALQSLWRYHQAMYSFHVGLTADHSYQSPAWQWPVLIRPTSMFYQNTDGWVQNIYSMPNPLVWVAGVVAVLYALWRFVVARDWRLAVVLTGIAVTYVPWLQFPERTTFQFYTIVVLPFVLLALTFALRDIARGGVPWRARAGDEPEKVSAYRRVTGQRLVLVFLGVALVIAAFWYPVVNGIPVPQPFYQMHNWVRSWI